MSPEMIGTIGVIVLIILLFMKFWIGIILAVIGMVGYALLTNWDKAFLMIGTEPFSHAATYTISAMPLFILMGNIVAVTGIAEDMYRVARNWIGQIKGGLAMATVVACGGFAAVSGCSMAGTATMGKIAYPEMLKYKYSERLASAVISAGGTIGILIPPSIGFIIYGLFTETSIGQLFMAGLIPGLTEIIFYGITIYIICRFNPSYGPPGPKVPLREKVSSLRNVWTIVVLFLLVIGGIYGGFFTPTEAGAIGAFGAIIIGLATKRVDLKGLIFSFRDTAQTTAMIMIMIAGSMIFNRFITVSKLPVAMGEYVAGLEISTILIIAGIVLLYLVIGCFVEITAAIVLTLPVIFPIVMSLGFNPFWFGVIMVRLMEVGAITPPLGLNLFILSKTVNIPVSTIYKSIFPFVIADFLNIAMLIAFPQISLYLVEMM
ncbi:MAG: TRAP transporter large permease subunit [Bacillota bacterium]|nr:TRAP transporter large permease subunit [Bacillota bacterium]